MFTHATSFKSSRWHPRSPVRQRISPVFLSEETRLEDVWFAFRGLCSFESPEKWTSGLSVCLMDSFVIYILFRVIQCNAMFYLLYNRYDLSDKGFVFWFAMKFDGTASFWGLNIVAFTYGPKKMANKTHKSLGLTTTSHTRKRYFFCIVCLCAN